MATVTPSAIVPRQAGLGAKSDDADDNQGMALEEYLPPLPEDEEYAGYTSSSRRRRRKSRKYNTRTRKLARWIARKILVSAAAKGAAYRAKMAAEETQRARAPPACTKQGKKSNKQLQVYEPDTVTHGSFFTGCFGWFCTTPAPESETPNSEQGAQCDLEETPQLPAPVAQPSYVQQSAPQIILNDGADTVPTMRVRCSEPAAEDPADMSAEDLHTFLKKLTRDQRSKLRKHLSVETPRRGVSTPRPVVTPREVTTSPRGPAKKDAFAAPRASTTPRLGLSPKMSSSPARAMRPVMTDVAEHGPVVARAVHEARPQPMSTRRGAAVAMSMPAFELQPWQDTEAPRPSTAGPVATDQRSMPALQKVATCPADKLSSSLSELVVSTREV